MSVTVKGTSNIPRLRAALQQLGKKEIQVGVFGEDSNVDEGPINLVTLARVHEFGMTIVPKRAKALTIPLIPEAKGKRASDFTGLFLHKTHNGNEVLARQVGKKQIQPVFLLLQSVTIPERSFLRTGFDENIGFITNKIKQYMQRVIDFKIDPHTFVDMIGLEFAGKIQLKMRDLKNPPNSSITEAVKKSSNPLIDTGRLVGSIRHKIK